MSVAPKFDVATLRKPEALESLCAKLKSREDLKEFHEIVDIAMMALNSSATNDYLEKIGAESIGAVHLTSKLGPDGRDSDGKGVEVKPSKGTFRAVINDDSPMKLLETHKSYSWLVLLNANKQGTRVNWIVVAPYSYWEQERFAGIVKRLDLTKNPEWKWGSTLPQDPETKTRCLTDLVNFHKELTYVRSNPLRLTVLADIPAEKKQVWIHPEAPKSCIPPALR